MRILHFEYSDFFRRVVHDMSVRLGYDYVGTSHGGDFGSMMANQTFDVVITGMALNDMDAEALIDKIRASKWPDLPVVILTSTNIADIHKRLKGLEFNDFITKETLNLDVLKRCISRMEHLNS